MFTELELRELEGRTIVVPSEFLVLNASRLVLTEASAAKLMHKLVGRPACFRVPLTPPAVTGGLHDDRSGRSKHLHLWNHQDHTPAHRVHRTPK
jgi:hypothetical protein